MNYTEMISARNDLDAELDEYHLKTVAVLRLARTRFRNDPVKRNNIQRLTAKGDSRSATFTEGKALEDQWRKKRPGLGADRGFDAGCFHAVPHRLP